MTTQGTWETVTVEFDGTTNPTLFACDKCGTASKALTNTASDDDEECAVCFLMEKLRWQMLDGRVVPL